MWTLASPKICLPPMPSFLAGENTDVHVSGCGKEEGTSGNQSDDLPIKHYLDIVWGNDNINFYTYTCTHVARPTFLYYANQLALIHLLGTTYSVMYYTCAFVYMYVGGFETTFSVTTQTVTCKC